MQVGRKMAIAIVIGSIVLALGVASWFVVTASDGLRDLPKFLADPADRWRLIGEYAADWPFYLALAAGMAGCVWLLVRFFKRGRV
jgi:hypothetical protein